MKHDTQTEKVSLGLCKFVVERVSCVAVRSSYITNQGIAGNWWSSSQYNANNAWNLNNGSLNNNKTNTNSVLPVFEFYIYRRLTKRAHYIV